MREKRNKTNLEYWTCIYCGYKTKKETLEEGKYIEHTKLGDAVECPRCQSEQFMER